MPATPRLEVERKHRNKQKKIKNKMRKERENKKGFISHKATFGDG